MADSMRDDQFRLARNRCEEAAASVRRAVRLLSDVRDVAGLNGAETQVPGCIEELSRMIARVEGAAGSDPTARAAGVDESEITAAMEDER